MDRPWSSASLPEQISAELAKAGFSLQTSHDFLPRQIFLVYDVKYRPIGPHWEAAVCDCGSDGRAQRFASVRWSHR